MSQHFNSKASAEEEDVMMLLKYLGHQQEAVRVCSSISEWVHTYTYTELVAAPEEGNTLHYRHGVCRKVDFTFFSTTCAFLQSQSSLQYVCGVCMAAQLYGSTALNNLFPLFLYPSQWDLAETFFNRDASYGEQFFTHNRDRFFFTGPKEKRSTQKLYESPRQLFLLFFLRSCPVFVSWPVDLEQGIGKRSLSSLIATNYVTT